MFGIGMPELILILVIGLIVFGPGKLPEMGRMLGKGMREFRKASDMLTQAMNAPDPPPARSMAPAPTAKQEPAQAAESEEELAPKSKNVVGEEKAKGEEPPKEVAPKAEKRLLDMPYEPPTQESVRATLEKAAGEKQKQEG